MKNKIYGRKVGSTGDMPLLIESNGVSTGGKKVDPNVIADIALASARRTVKMLRDKGIEGYVEFEGDSKHYEFTPASDFVYPVAIGSFTAARRWRETWGYIGRGGVVVVLDGEVQSWV